MKHFFLLPILFLALLFLPGEVQTTTHTCIMEKCHESHESHYMEKCPSCGGSLRYKATYRKQMITCSVCNGSGKVGPKKEYQCSNCKGTGQDYYWVGAYICQKCGAVYED